MGASPDVLLLAGCDVALTHCCTCEGRIWRMGTSAGVEILRVRILEEPSHPFQFSNLIDRPRRRVVTFIDTGIDHVQICHRSFLKLLVLSHSAHNVV